MRDYIFLVIFTSIFIVLVYFAGRMGYEAERDTVNLHYKTLYEQKNETIEDLAKAISDCEKKRAKCMRGGL